MHANLEHTADPMTEAHPDAASLRSHGCFACLTGRMADKRACAAAKMLAAGFDPAVVAGLLPSPNNEH